ncbi:MAG: hypothetical protein ACR2J8_09185 [Thermomicrobiales bacterium]
MAGHGLNSERRALWIYPWDILDSGIEETVARASGEWGLNAFSLTPSYHSAKFVLPRRSSEKVFLSGGSAVYFRPDDSLYAKTSLRPVVTQREHLLDVLDRTADAAHRAGMTLRAWTVGLHNSKIGEVRPDVAERNVFGDVYPWALCPAHPDVREYLVALVRDIATNHAVDAIDLESTGYHGLYHGHHHELIGITWGQVDEFLMGLCFCDHCLRRGAEAGIDGASLRARVAGMLEQRFRDEAMLPAKQPGDNGPATLMIDWPELYAWVRMRLETVTSLVAEVKERSLAGTDVTLALTASTFQRGSEFAWLEGMDLAALAGPADEIIALAYFQDPLAVAAEIQFQRGLVGDVERIVAGMSILAQGTTSAANLVEKVNVARSLGVRKFSFYNFGFVSEARLGWLGKL